MWMKKSIERRLKEIINKQIGIGHTNFSIKTYIRENWLSEEDLIKAIKTLIKERK